MILACFVALCQAIGVLAAESAKPIDVYLIAGQSNATGQGYMANLPDGFATDPRVLLFHSGKPHLDSGTEPHTWLPLHQASESPDRFGLELGFGNRLAELRPDMPIALIKHAHSGSNLYRDWDPGKDAADLDHFGPQFKIFVETVRLGLKALREQGYNPTIRGMVWQQGEGDSKTQETAGEYGKNLARFIARVREQSQAPDMPFIYGYVLPPPNAGHQRDLVRQGEKEVDQDSGAAIAVRGAFVVATDDLSQRADDRNTRYPDDHVHFGTAGTLELGRRMAAKMAETSRRPTAIAAEGDYGTVAGVDASGIISIVPWGKKPADAKPVKTGAASSVLVNLDPAKVANLKEGMWVKILDRDAEGAAQRVIAGQFLKEDGDKVVVFKGMPEEFLLYRPDGWYTNTVGGVRFKVQPMGAGKTPSNPGSNLRAAEYKEPAGGFVVYFPKTLHGAVLGWGGFKPGANVPDEDGKVLVNRDTCTDYYWKHLKNPARPEAGYVSGMTEFTIRKLPARP